MMTYKEAFEALRAEIFKRMNNLCCNGVVANSDKDKYLLLQDLFGYVVSLPVEDGSPSAGKSAGDVFGKEPLQATLDYLNMDSCEVVESGDESPLVGEEPDDRDDDTELTPFERAVEGVMDNIYHVTNEHAKNVARELLDLARAELKDEKPVSGELEEAAQEYAENHFQDFIETEDDPGYWCSRFGFIAGANWQKQEDQESIKFVEEPDLDKAAKEHAANLYGEDWMKNEHIQDNGFKAISNFKFGAGWHKQQMMKDAVDATVHQGLYDSKYVKEQDSDTLNKALEKYNPGDEVKIIIIKEGQ